MGPERKLENKCKVEAARRGGILRKWTCPGYNGYPDRILIMPGGSVYFIEFKALGKKATKLQQERLNQLQALGCRALVIDDFEDFHFLVIHHPPL